MLTIKNQYGYRMNITRTDAVKTEYETKWEKMRAVEDLLRRRALNKTEIARMFGVNRSTAARWINEMSRLLPIQEIGKWKLRIVDNN
jgi:transposase